MSGLRVLLAFDHPGVRARLRSVLDGRADVHLLEDIDGERDVEQAVKRLCPDVLILDRNLLGLDPIRATRQLAERHPGIQVLVLTAYDSRTDEALAHNLEVPVSFRGGAGGDDLMSLTPRELEILSLIGTGADNSEIARRLCISKRTVETHVSNIYAKLQLAGRPQAVLYAVENGLAGSRGRARLNTVQLA